ncbi:MAG: gliding motility-associated C-terminal domain-containing protein [Bacteroidetes bacterium]|nr:gliding motility-associated C-terminal domain-containing protein [Bacteroidota bacterium]
MKTRIILILGFLSMTFLTAQAKVFSPGDTIAKVIVVPNVFSPEKEGGEKLFHISTLQNIMVKSMKLEIFNRWGQIVFKTDNLNQGWDGNYKGTKMESGVYMYMLTGEIYSPTNSSGTIKIDRKGTFTLIR